MWLSLTSTSVFLVVLNVDIEIWFKVSIIPFLFLNHVFADSNFTRTFFNNINVCEWLHMFNERPRNGLMKPEHVSVVQSLRDSKYCSPIYTSCVNHEYLFTKITTYGTFFCKLLMWSFILTFNIENFNSGKIKQYWYIFTQVTVCFQFHLLFFFFYPYSNKNIPLRNNLTAK